MGFMANLKAQKAYQLHSKGKYDEALPLYKEAVEKGLDQPRFLLTYAVLLIRLGEYQQAKDLLVKTQKAPGITPEQKVQLFMDYAVCCYKLGDINRGIGLLEKQHQRQPTGMVYETLGYLYVESVLPKYKPSVEAFQAVQEAQAAAAAQAAAVAAGMAEEDPEAVQVAEEVPAAQPEVSAEEMRDAWWQERIDKVRAFIEESLEYDEEDAICLDNMGQFLYRVMGDKAGAKEWFEKAHAVKPSQIDTLWFLSRYDVEAGDKAAALEKLETALEGRFSALNYCTKAMVEEEISKLK